MRSTTARAVMATLLGGTCWFACGEPVASAVSSGASSSGGGSSDGARAGVEVSYVPRGQYWVDGRKDDMRAIFSGWSLDVYLQTMVDFKGARMPAGIMYWRDELVNTHREDSVDGGEGTELAISEGLGLAQVMHSAESGGMSLVMLGVERLRLRQTGDTPLTQRYPWGVSGRVGLGGGWGFGFGSLDLRVDYTYKHFFSARSGETTLYPAEYQAFMPTLCFSAKF